MRTEEFNIPSGSGAKHAAWLDQPAGEVPVAYAIFAYCFPGKQQSTIRHISLALTQQRIAVLRLDFTGTHSSAHSDVPASADQLLAAAAWLEKEYSAPSLLIGHSVAGAAAIIAAAKLPAIKALVSIGAPAHEKFLQPLLDEDMLEEEYAEIVYSDTHQFNIELELLDALDEKKMQQRTEELKKPLLIMHSPLDKHISVDSAASLYINAMHPKSFVTLDDSDHFLSKSHDSLYAGNIIAAWVQRYIDLKEPEDLRTHMEVVCRTCVGGFTTEIRAGDHAMLADEPESYGGDNLGPNPYDLLNAALGACTSMTLRLYADNKKWPLKEAIVHLKHDKVYAEDCSSCEEEMSKLDELSREIELIGDLDEEQRKRLIDIANKCPVHKTLTSDLRISTKEVKD